MSLTVTQAYGIELQGIACPLLFASRCREWAQATYAKQVGDLPQPFLPNEFFIANAKETCMFDIRAQPLPPLAPRECARPPPWLAPRQRAKAHPCSKFFGVSQQGREYASRCFVQVEPAYLAAGDRVMIMTGSKEALHGCTGVIAEVKPGPELLVAVSACEPLSPAQSRERGAKRGEARLRELIAEVFDELAGGRLLSLAYGDDHLSESGTTPSLLRRLGQLAR
jgi:hypothetical protein